MGLAENITNDMKTAMKAKDANKLAVIRMLRSAIRNKEIDSKQTLTEAEVIGVVRSMVKQREDSIEMFKKGDREDLAAKESSEIEVLSAYLPASLSEAEMETLVKDAIDECGATSMKDMGNVMKAVSAKSEGRADNRVISGLVKKALN